MPTGLGAFLKGPAVVGIPGRDEVEPLGDCLTVLSGKIGPAPALVLVVNNTSDGTMGAEAEEALSPECPAVAIERRFPPAHANAGQARRGEPRGWPTCRG